MSTLPAAPGATPAPVDQLAAIVPGGIGVAPVFPATSRYSGLPLATVERAGRVFAYVTRRFVPPSERFALVSEHVVTAGERPDTIAAAVLGDPEQFWRLCDANNLLFPGEMAEIGRRVRVTLPEGLGTVSDD